MKKSTRMTWWRLMTFILAAAFLLGACAPAATQTQQAATAPPQVIRETVVVTTAPEKVVETQVVEVPVTPTAGPQTGPVLNPDVSGKIELWHFWASPVRRAGVGHFVALCKQKLPNIEVTDVVKPFGDIWTANIAAVASGTGMPDVIVSDRPTLPKDAAEGIYMDLQEWADRDNVKRDQFYPWSWDQTLYQDHTYGIPFETDVRVLFWNKQLFQEAGLDPNKPPETWSQLKEYADKLDKKDAKGNYTRMAFMPLWNAGFDIWTYSNNADLIAADGTPQINNPKAVETMQWIKDWIDRYGGWQKVQDFQAKFGAPPNDIFMANGAAMIVDIFGYNSFLEFYRPRADIKEPLGQITGDDPRMEWGIGLMPHGDDADPGDWSGGFSMSIPTGAKNPEAAWEFIKCVTGAEGQASWARDTQAQPTNVQAAQDPILTANPNWKVVDEALKVSTGGVTVTKYPNWSEQLSQRYESVWKGDMTPQQALDEAQKAVEDQVK